MVEAIQFDIDNTFSFFRKIAISNNKKTMKIVRYISDEIFRKCTLFIVLSNALFDFGKY